MNLISYFNSASQLYGKPNCCKGLMYLFFVYFLNALEKECNNKKAPGITPRIRPVRYFTTGSSQLFYHKSEKYQVFSLNKNNDE